MSEASTEATATESAEAAKTESEAASTDTEQQSTDYAAEAEKWKALAQKHEQRAKSNAEKAKGYDELKASSLTEQEKAVEAAKSEARQAALTEAGSKLVAAEFRVALAGRRTADEVAKLIEDYDLSKYLDDSGEVDTKRVAEKADLLAPKEERRPAPSFGGGARKTSDKAEAAPGLPRLRQAYADTNQ